MQTYLLPEKRKPQENTVKLPVRDYPKVKAILSLTGGSRLREVRPQNHGDGGGGVGVVILHSFVNAEVGHMADGKIFPVIKRHFIFPSFTFFINIYISIFFLVFRGNPILGYTFDAVLDILK